MKVITTLRISCIALLLAGPLCLPLRAGFKDWVASKLPYKLPPEKLNFASLRPDSATEVLDRNNQRLFYLSGPKLRFYRPISEISENLQKFVILSEDAKFYSHEGFDVEEIENSIKKNFTSNKIKRGASTITQQLAKNIFLDKKKSVTRKLFEVPWTMQLERDLTKKQILELYLNIIEWGPGIHGAEAASRHYFDKSAAEIDAREALYLAMIVPNPPRFDGYASAKMRDFIWSKCKTFAQRIYSEKKITLEERDFMLSGPAPLATLEQKNRKYPLQHAGKYTGSIADFESKWGELAAYIRRTDHGKKSPVQVFLDKKFDESVLNVPLTQTASKDKNAPIPYLIYEDDKGIAGYRKLKRGQGIPSDAVLSNGLRLENDFSLEELFYVRPPQASSLSTEPVEGSGENSSTL
jgi:monofunctional biosynthetic peptidoglycan transglycosylase